MNHLSVLLADISRDFFGQGLDTQQCLLYSGIMNKQIHPQETGIQYWKDRTAYLEAENAQLRAENASMMARMKELEAQIEALTARVHK